MRLEEWINRFKHSSFKAEINFEKGSIRNRTSRIIIIEYLAICCNTASSIKLVCKLRLKL